VRGTSAVEASGVLAQATTLPNSAQSERAGAATTILSERPPSRAHRRRHLWVSEMTMRGLQIALLACVFTLWETAANHGWVRESFSSKPSEIWDAFWRFQQSGQMWDSTVATMKAVILAFVIGTVTGTVVGFVLGMSRFLDRLLGPFLVPLNSIPRLALAPLFILWFGLTMEAKVWLAVSIVFFILVLNARAAVKSVQEDLLVMGRVFGLGRIRMVTSVIFPSAVPAIFAGVRLAVTYSLLGVVGSEMIGARDGLGQNIVSFSGRFDVASTFAVLALLAMLATAVNVIFELIERRLLRWQTA
jgi:NitT/TauT family transport system permease protein